ncbi:MAG: AI-2E family transporter, partial [Sulfurifustis sp.]
MKSETIKKSDDDIASSTSSRARRFARIDARPVRGWVVTALFVLAVFYTLYLTRDLTLPIVLALLLHFLLRPVVRALQRLYIPARIGAALVVAAVVGVIAVAGYVLSDPIAEWAQKAPEIAQQLERKLRPIKEKVEEVNKAAAQVEQMTNVEAPRTPTVQVRPHANVRDAVWARIQPLLTGIVVMFFLLYFLLATGEQLIARIARIAATREGSREIIEITDAVERNVSRYLAAVTLINAGLGAAAALITWAFGMPNPLLWGVLAMLLNFIPYL